MSWLWIGAGTLATLAGVAAIIAHNMFDDEDPDLDPWDSYK